MAQPDSYIWQQSDWPVLRFDLDALAGPLLQARREQGVVLGQAQAIGLPEIDGVLEAIWIDEAVATAAIEGEKLDLAMVRSSVMRRLGILGTGPVSRSVDGLVDVMQDATAAFDTPLDADRLCRWQSALFPGGTSSLRRIEVGRFRSSAEPMQIVSGPIGRETVHYLAPPSKRVAREISRFIAWFTATNPRRSPAPKGRGRPDGIVRAALAHLWFEAIHPFEDGNGRVGRAIVDMALAQDLASPVRLYRLSRQLMEHREAYYDELNCAQRGDTDVTRWIGWFTEQFVQACLKSQAVMRSAVAKSRYWSSRTRLQLNERQRKVVQRLLDAGEGGFEGGMSAEKYGRLTGVSKATATRDLASLLRDGWLTTTGTGKATRYWVNLTGWMP